MRNGKKRNPSIYSILFSSLVELKEAERLHQEQSLAQQQILPIPSRLSHMDFALILKLYF